MMSKAEALLTVFASLVSDPMFAQAKQSLRKSASEDPLDALVATLTVGTIAFFRAEKGKNPKVLTLADALEFVSTNLSVGYCDIFPRTEAGKLIASAVMAIGPALATKALDPPMREQAAKDAAAFNQQQEILEKLDAILRELQARRA